MINHFFPINAENAVYEVGDTLTLTSNSGELDVFAPNEHMILSEKELPIEYKVTFPGVHTFTRCPISGTIFIENIFVKIPSSESNIFPTEEYLPNPTFYTSN